MKRILLLCFVFLGLFQWAGCTEKDIQIHFETNGGSAILDISMKDFDINNLPITQKEGYVFVGWYLDEALREPLGKTINLEQSFTLYAKFTPITYLVQFQSNGGSPVQPITRTAQDTTITEPEDPTKEGFVFVGWYLDEALTTLYQFDHIINDNITLYAKWEAVALTYIITFESNGGSTIAPITLTQGETIILPDEPVKDSFAFAGWYTDMALTLPFELTQMPTYNLILYAKWSAIVTITFATQGGSALEPIIGKPQDIISIDQPTKPGYIFSGWYLGIDEIEPIHLSVIPDSSITLYADWASEGLIFELMDEDTAYEVSRDIDTEIINLYIPKLYHGKPVTHIKEAGFQDSEFTLSIHLPITIKTIGSRAWMSNTSLKDVYLPKDLETLGSAVFRHCFALEVFDISQSSTHFSVVDDILFSKDLESIWRYPAAKTGTSYSVPNHVKIIEEDAFSGSQYLSSLDLGSGLTTIKDHAFYGMISLTSIIIPNQVETMGIYVFRDCISLENVTLGSGLTSINAYLFDNCSSLTSIIIPYGITLIGYGAFSFCTHLTHVYILRTSLNGLITGTNFMFSNTSSLLQLYFPDATTRDAYKVAYYWSSYASKMNVGSPS